MNSFVEREAIEELSRHNIINLILREKTEMWSILTVALQ